MLASVCVSVPAASGCSPGSAPSAQGPSKLTREGATGTSGAAEDAPVTTASVELLPPGRDPVIVRVEIVRTDAERQRGLMYRKHLDSDAGMLFLFEAPQQLTFWMRNTYVPLDMMFIEPSLRVLGVVENAEPLTETSRFVPGKSQYVLEVNAGFSREHGIGSGTAVRFVGVEGFAASAGAAQ